jgi:methionyl-tRNA formyltransferase
VTRSIAPDETSDVVERDLAEAGARLLVDVVGRIDEGTATAEPQEATLATYAHRLTKEEGLVDWTRPALDIHNRVRGLYPWPHAYTYLDGARTILLKTHVVNADSGTAGPGEVVGVSREAIHVATGDAGVIAIDELQAEGRKPVRAREFLAGRAVRVGSRFTAR